MGADPYSSRGHAIDLINGKLVNVVTGQDVKFKILDDHVRIDCHVISARATQFIFEKIFETQAKKPDERKIIPAPTTEIIPKCP